MSVLEYKNGAWQEPSSIKTYKNGAYQEVTQANAYKNGAWQKVYPNSQNLVLGVDIPCTVDKNTTIVDPYNITYPSISSDGWITFTGKFVHNSLVTCPRFVLTSKYYDFRNATKIKYEFEYVSSSATEQQSLEWIFINDGFSMNSNYVDNLINGNFLSETDLSLSTLYPRETGEIDISSLGLSSKSLVQILIFLSGDLDPYNSTSGATARSKFRLTFEVPA